MTDTGNHPAAKSRKETEADMAGGVDPTAPVGVLTNPALTDLPAQSDSTLGEPSFRAHYKSREEIQQIHEAELRAQAERTS